MLSNTATNNDFYGKDFFQEVANEPPWAVHHFSMQNASNNSTSKKARFSPFNPSTGPIQPLDCFFQQQENESKKIPNLRKTKICLCYKMGNCPNGPNCAFAHGEHELREQPNFYKTSLCIPYMSGKECRFGVKCRFAHGYNELRPRPENSTDEKSLEAPLKVQSQLYNNASNSKCIMNGYDYQSGNLKNLNELSNVRVYPYVQFESLEEKMKRCSNEIQNLDQMKGSTTSSLCISKKLNCAELRQIEAASKFITSGTDLLSIFEKNENL